ncbi:MAG: hypothetical protein KC613_20200 [Myxococcales bacterium]|nr:hypothetical protein [Myxococcales bacterium]
MSLVKRLFDPTKRRPLVLGHRGVPKQAPENTLEGLAAARALGLDGVEVDVMCTADDEVVLFHDDDTERLCDVKAKVAELTFAELCLSPIQRRFDRGDGVFVDYGRPHRIPRLSEALGAFPDLLFNLELKPSVPAWGERHVGRRVAEVIEACGAQDRVFVTSFDFFKLRALEQASPGLHSGFAYDDDFTGYLPTWLDKLPEWSTEFSFAAGNQNRASLINGLLEADGVGRHIGSTVMGLEHSLIDGDTIERVHAKGLAVGAYTMHPLDTRNVAHRPTDAEFDDLARALAARGLDWFEGDDPERLLKVLGR